MLLKDNKNLIRNKYSVEIYYPGFSLLAKVCPPLQPGHVQFAWQSAPYAFWPHKTCFFTSQKTPCPNFWLQCNILKAVVKVDAEVNNKSTRQRRKECQAIFPFLVQAPYNKKGHIKFLKRFVILLWMMSTSPSYGVSYFLQVLLSIFFAANKPALKFCPLQPTVNYTANVAWHIMRTTKTRRTALKGKKV